MSLAAKLDDATFLRSFHAWATIGWSVHLPAVVVMYFVWPAPWQKISILYLALVSIYANLVSHWGAWQSSRAEIKVDESSK